MQSSILKGTVWKTSGSQTFTLNVNSMENRDQIVILMCNVFLKGKFRCLKIQYLRIVFCNSSSSTIIIFKYVEFKSEIVTCIFFSLVITLQINKSVPGFKVPHQ